MTLTTGSKSTMGVIRELLDEMLQGEFQKARDQVSRISDLAALFEVREILEESTDTVEKMYCYWILGDLGRNTQSPEVADYLMQRVGIEELAKLKKLALDKIFLLQGVANSDQAVLALQDGNRDVRRSATEALGACTDAKSEQALIDVIQSGTDPIATRSAASALARRATGRSEEALVALIARMSRNKQNEVTIAAALLALSRIDAQPALTLAVNDLKAAKSAVVNWACMLTIWKRGTADQIDVVVSRLTSLLKKKSRSDMEFLLPMVETDFNDELSAGVSFLQKFPDERVDRFIAFLRQNESSLLEREKQFLATKSGTLK